ncbi:MAG: zinc ABC transporter ATP-binding protein [Candidatus Moranbacteria bacterium CG_4_10_14_3_um_filter_45_9]|nr:MAG: zinc ABC transporter ATP-binding protein [Candidatus Moranbacteria bacterium CG_4_10_14_3_um_filter_45_9]PJA85011.1 MAG: zinc ABC transporter ATP-binding protein [Candidatus Moranbacteria bacterium CG_4_9_14_3_um_filter_45_14]
METENGTTLKTPARAIGVRVDHSKNIIEVQDVFFSYDGKTNVLKNITFTVHPGDYVGLIGPNGAGKTTLLKSMLGLLSPTRGEIRLFGQKISEFKDWYKVGYVPQKATYFDAGFPATVEEVVLMGRYAKRGLFARTTVEDRKLVKESLKQVDMWEYKKRLIGDLSGGQQQRVFIARAIVSQPEVIFLDEPTAGIDRQAQNDFYVLLRKLNRELGLTLVLISHDIERVTNEVMHIAWIDRTLESYSSPEEYLRMRKKEQIVI